MPEGPEVWVLSQAINLYNSKYNTFAHGKHLIITDKVNGVNIYFDWSFGLTGKVNIDETRITKLDAGAIYGKKEISCNKPLHF